MIKTKLSIITINYNNKLGLQKTFESIQNQTWQDFEFIVIDGGSTDGDKELIENNSRINYWISEKDNGVYNAMNKGIKVAKGDYIIFMNSGDFFYRNSTLEKVERFLNNETSIIYGNSLFFKEDGFRKEVFAPKKLTFGFFYNDGINHQASFIKKDLFFKYFLYNETYKICADWEFFVYTICGKNESYLHLDEFICNYDFTGFSSDEKYRSIHKLERNQTLEKYFPTLVEDYKKLDEINSKRIKQVIYIKNHKKLAWRFQKWFLDILLLFTNKKKI